MCRETSGEKFSKKIFAEKLLEKKSSKKTFAENGERIYEENICRETSAAEILDKKTGKKTGAKEYGDRNSQCKVHWA